MIKMAPGRYELSAREQKYALEERMLPDIVFEMKDELRPDLLCRAAHTAVHLHPLFGTQLIKEHLFLLEETENWEQHPDGALIGGGGKGPCLWSIRCRGKKLILSASHTLTDWGGLFRFAASLLHLYLEYCGVEFSPKAACDLPASPEETTIAARRVLAFLPCNPLGVPKFPPATQLPETWFDAEMKGGLYHLVFSDDTIHRFASHSETSVFSVIACLLARSAREAFDMNDGSIIIRVPVDYRRTFSCITDHNFSQGFPLCYQPKKMNPMSDASVETAFRSQLDLYIDRDQMIRTLQKDTERLIKLENGTVSLESLNRYREGADGSSACILYSHLTHPGLSEELCSHIEQVYAVPHSVVPYMIFVYSISFGGTISTTILQHVADDRFISALQHALKRKQIDYQLSELLDE